MGYYLKRCLSLFIDVCTVIEIVELKVIIGNCSNCFRYVFVLYFWGEVKKKLLDVYDILWWFCKDKIDLSRKYF